MIPEIIVAEGFKKSLDELFNYLKKKSSSYAKLKNFDVDNSFRKASKVEEVKTIWQVDKFVNLNQFYYPSKLDVSSKRLEIVKLTDLPPNGKLVIQGTAGQGKSIFLRYLTGMELKHGSKIPIFIELRKISDKISLEDLIVSSLLNLGIENDKSVLDYIFESNKCVLILDAFDEVKENQVIDTLTYIEDLCHKYDGLKIIISSRPNGKIQQVSFFSVFDLCPLIPSDFPEMLENFFQDNDDIKIDEIIKAIHKGDGIAELITTPLLLTLLTITYKSYHKIPEKLHEFYDKLYYLLVNRHDSTKPGFKREFKTGLNENQLEELFCAFCFYCMLNGEDTLTHSEAVTLVKKAKAITLLDNTSENFFLDDTKSNTCLIVEEGFEYHFIHKSIKEYHAAKFISDSPTSLKERFYSLAIQDPFQYSQVVTYLGSIDSYYHNKLFLIPLYLELFDLVEPGGILVNVDDCIKGVKFYLSDGRFAGGMIDNIIIRSSKYFDLMGCVFVVTNKLQPREEFTSSDTEFIEITELYDNIDDEFKNQLQIYIDEKKVEYRKIVKQIEQQEKAISSIEFD